MFTKNEQKVILEFSKNDFKTKYAGSIFGMFWAFIQPIFTVILYWFVNQIEFGSQPVGGTPYIVWLLCGMVPWFFIQDAWLGLTNVFFDYSFLVRKVVFNASLLPFSRLLSRFFVNLFFIALLNFVLLFYGILPKLIYLQTIYYIICSLFLALGLGELSAALSAFFKDVPNVIEICVQFGFWLTPIFWDISLAGGSVAFILKLNPVYYIVQGYRNTFIYNVWFFGDWLAMLNFWLIAAAIFAIGRFLFSKVKPHLADLI
jgi:teichoic acid transport system permease protein